MLLSTEIQSVSELVGFEKAIELTAKAGFDAWDFSMFRMFRHDGGKIIPGDNPLGSKNYLDYAKKLRRTGEENGIVCNQSHAPFPSIWPDAKEYLIRALECTAEAGGKICVIHPGNDSSAEENAEMYRELLVYAKEFGIKIAAENMWGWDAEKDESSFAACATSESFLKHLELVDDEYFVACLDIGHAEMRGSGDGAENMIRALGHHLQALHIHDNDRHFDSHELPFTMDIDFSRVVKALKDIGYKGDFTLEADRFFVNRKGIDAETGLGICADAVKRLRKMFDEV